MLTLFIIFWRYTSLMLGAIYFYAKMRYNLLKFRLRYDINPRSRSEHIVFINISHALSYIANPSGFISLINSLEFINVGVGNHMETCVFKHFFCLCIISNTKNNISVFFCASHKCVKIFHIDICFIKDIKCH